MNPRTIEAVLFHRDECVLGEGPLWFDRRLWWVDIERGLLCSVDEKGGDVRRWPLGRKVGSAAPIDENRFLVALDNGLARLRLDSGEITPLPETEPPPGHRFNDGKCDPAGRFLVGTMSPGGMSGTAALYAYGSGHALRLLRGGATISNGLAWSADGRILYYIDTPRRAVFAYAYDAEKGEVSRERVAVSFSERDGYPDGMAIDRDGNLWVAFWDGWAVRSYRPADGACVAEIPIPCARPTSCCFGGPGMDRLFITTARRDVSGDDLARQPLAGSLFVCDPGTTGFPPSPFLENSLA